MKTYFPFFYQIHKYAVNKYRQLCHKLRGYAKLMKAGGQDRKIISIHTSSLHTIGMCCFTFCSDRLCINQYDIVYFYIYTTTRSVLACIKVWLRFNLHSVQHCTYFSFINSPAEHLLKIEIPFCQAYCHITCCYSTI